MDSATPGTDNAGTGATGRTVGGRYTLRSTVGSGGMGTVWKSHDELLRRDVAVKEVLLPPHLPEPERALLCERTLREARAAAALTHPSVIRVYDVVIESDRPWIVMELLDARSISEVLREDGPISVRQVAQIGLAVLGALEAAHRVGVLHRDVKPGNVLIGRDGRTTLTDFGVARSPNESPLTSTGLLLGSPQYIAPERARGRPFGPSSDLWSLGATMYTAIEGRPPFDRGDPLPTMTAVVCEPPDPFALAGPLEEILDGLMEKDPDQRWDGDRARAALKAVLAGEVRPKPDPDSPTVNLGKTSRVRPPRQQKRAAAHSRTNQRLGDARGTISLAPTTDAPTQSQPARHRAQAGRATARVSIPSPAANPTGANHVEPSPTTAMPISPSAPRRAAFLPQPPPAMQPTGRFPAGHDPVGPAPISAPPVLISPSQSSTSTAGTDWRRWRWAFFAVAAIVVVLVAGLGTYMVSSALADPMKGTQWKEQSQEQPTGSGIELSPYTDKRGFTVMVPKGWTVTPSGGNYVDFKDPNSTRFVRVKVENAGGTQQTFYVAAENYVKNGGGSVTNYERVHLRESQVRLGDSKSDSETWEWEWTWSNTKNEARHIRERGAVIGGKSYQVYLSVPEADFATYAPMLDEITKSFKLNS